MRPYNGMYNSVKRHHHWEYVELPPLAILFVYEPITLKHGVLACVLGDRIFPQSLPRFQKALIISARRQETSNRLRGQLTLAVRQISHSRAFLMAGGFTVVGFFTYTYYHISQWASFASS